MNELMRLEAEHHAGEHYDRHTDINHWGTQRGYVRVGGQKVTVKRPRIRSKSDGKEVPLETY